MKCFLYIILYILFICRHGHFFEQEKFDYIKNKFENATKELNIYLKTMNSKDVEIKIDFFNTTYEKLINFDNPYIFQLSNKTYFLLGSEIFLWTNLNKSPINKTYSLSDIEKYVTLVTTSKEFQNKTFMLTSFKSDVSHVYMFKNVENPVHIQTLKHNQKLKDATFFINKNSLYLITVNTKEAIFYQWVADYFDQIHVIQTKSTKLSSFTYLNLEIISFLDNQGTITSYQFDGNYKKIQHMKIPHCYNFKVYHIEQKVYMIFFAGKDNFIYAWDNVNAEFVYHMEFQSMVITERVTISSVDGINLMFLLSKFGAQVYRVSTHNIQYLSYIKFKEPFKSTLDVIEEEKQLHIFAKSEDEDISLLNIQYVLHYTDILNSESDEDPIENCLSFLRDNLEKQLNTQKATYKHKKREDVTNEPDFNPYELALTKFNGTTEDIQHKIVAILSKANKLTNNVVNKNILIKGDLTSQKLKAKNIQVDVINNFEWTPGNWLSYTKDQTITNQLEAKIMNSKKVLVTNTTFLNKLIINNENITMYKPIKINNLECKHLSTDSINGINFENIYLKSRETTLKGLKTFKTVLTENLKTSNFNYPSCDKNIKTDKLNFTPNLEVQNLIVERINNIKWDELKQSLYQKGKTKKIAGTLSVRNVTINALHTNKINGIDVKEFLTKLTNQTVKSKINFHNVTVKNLNVTKINGNNFSGIALTNFPNTVIAGPVKIKKLKAINIIPSVDDSDTTQKYYNKLKIIGDIRIKNIILPENAKIFLVDEEFNFDVSNDYWLKDTNQTIPENIKMFNLTTKNIDVQTINGYKVNDYMIIGKSRDEVLNYHFKHLNVTGNVKLNRNMEHSPNWSELNENIVRKSGGYKISGKKIFYGTIIVREANINYINDVEVDNVQTVKINDLSDCTFNTVIIKGNLTLKKTTVDNINDIEINEYYNDVMFIDEEIRFETLYLKNLTVDELHVEENLNGRNLKKYINEVDKINNIKQIGNVTSEGNVLINSVCNVKSINGVPLELIEEAVRKGVIMPGNVTFKKDVVIENFFVTYLNDINIPHLMKRLLYKNWKQSISGNYTFNIIKTDHLVASRINDYNVQTLIDVRKESPQTIRGNFKFKSVKFLNGLNGEMTCNLNDAMELIKNPQIKTWKSVEVIGNVTTLTKNNVLQEILDNVVKLDEDNIINAPVRFLSTVHVNFVKSNKDINGVDFKNIFNDALRKTKQDQIITGHKIFNRITCAGAQVDKNTDIPTVNTIHIRTLNNSLILKEYLHNNTIRGHKIFTAGIKTNYLKTRGSSGLNLENLVNLDNLKPIPNVILQTLNVTGNLTINYINNNTNLENFLRNRFLKNSKEQELLGGYYFDKIELKGPSKITKINNMYLDDIVLDNDVKQNITAPKHFSGNINVDGNVTIDVLNDFNITEKYHESVFYNKISTLNEVVLQNKTEINSDIIVKSINGIPIENITKILEHDDLQKETKKVNDVINEIKNIVNKYHIKIDDMPRQYMYLETSYDLQINIPNTISAEIFESKHHVLLHITGEEQGQKCGLPKICNCQNQLVLQISQDYALQTLGNKEHERVFSFHSDSIVAHLITHTVSYNRICTRTNFTNYPHESTTLTWISRNGSSKQSRTYVKYNLIEGFITGAKFFTYLNEVYVIVSSSYTSSLMTHNLDCVIFKFGHKEDTIEIIQRIPTKSAWTLHLFNSYQGLILVIGNIYDSEKIISGTSSDIYIFNHQTLQFVLLRKFIGAGAISIADVVLNKETQIILAQRDSPLIILRYNPDFNNFYMLQNLHLESEVLSVSKFYLGESKKDAYLNVVTENNHFYLFSYKYIEGWKLESKGEIDGVRTLVPFSLNRNIHLLALSTKLSSLLTVQTHG